MHDRIVALADELIDARRDESQLDVVDDFAHPLPVTVICELLGVPREDESRFDAWADTLAHSVDPGGGQETLLGGDAGRAGLATTCRELIAARRAEPGDDLLSGLAAGGTMPLYGRRQPRDHDDSAPDRGSRDNVNLITNGTLTLLRYPAELE